MTSLELNPILTIRETADKQWEVMDGERSAATFAERINAYAYCHGVMWARLEQAMLHIQKLDRIIAELHGRLS